MEPTNILIALIVMLLPMVVVGFVISKFIIKECSAGERIAFTVSFGTLFIYLIYFLLKNNIMMLTQFNILAVIAAIIIVYFLKHGFGTKFVGWLITQRRE